MRIELSNRLITLDKLTSYVMNLESQISRLRCTRAFDILLLEISLKNMLILIVVQKRFIHVTRAMMMRSQIAFALKYLAIRAISWNIFDQTVSATRREKTRVRRNYIHSTNQTWIRSIFATFIYFSKCSHVRDIVTHLRRYDRLESHDQLFISS
jgi:hypothetical protein